MKFFLCGNGMDAVVFGWWPRFYGKRKIEKDSKYYVCICERCHFHYIFIRTSVSKMGFGFAPFAKTISLKSGEYKRHNNVKDGQKERQRERIRGKVCCVFIVLCVMHRNKI